MAKISIDVNSRDLRDLLESALGAVPSGKAPGLLKTLEKIALGKSAPERFEVGVTAVRYVSGRFEIEPRNEDLLKEAVVTSLFHGAGHKVLGPLHANLFSRLFSAVGQSAEPPGSRSAQAKQGAGSGPRVATSGGPGLKAPGAGTRVDGPVGADVAAVAFLGLSVEEKGSEPGGREAEPGVAQGIALGEKQLFRALKSALEGLPFADLLTLNVATLSALAASKNGAAPAPIRASKRLVGIGSTLWFEVENEEATSASLIPCLLGGLGFPTLMQLNAEFSQRMNAAHGGSRKPVAKSVKLG